jgi:predicted HTH transcriptional regulator
MILTNKFLFLLSVAASSFAAPLVENDAIKYEERDIVNLHSRNAGVVPDSVTCGTVTIPKAKILDALTASRTPGLSDSSVNNPDGKEYPAFYGNKGTDGRGKTGSVLSFAAARKSVFPQSAVTCSTLTDLNSREKGTSS